MDKELVLTGMVVNGVQEAFKKPEFQQNHDFMRLGYRHSARLAFLSANVSFPVMQVDNLTPRGCNHPEAPGLGLDLFGEAGGIILATAQPHPTRRLKLETWLVTHRSCALAVRPPVPVCRRRKLDISILPRLMIPIDFLPFFVG